jgi:pimeloyl-ACP methyl ester carboxylesterase
MAHTSHKQRRQVLHWFRPASALTSYPALEFYMRSLLASIVLWLLTVIWSAAQVSPPAHVMRNDFYVPSDNGMRLFVREVVDPEAKQAKPILLVHGARVPGLASFDLQVPGGSLAEDLARRGLDVYVMDVRGYGASTRPKEMEEPATAHAPLVRSNQAARDIGAVVAWIREHKQASQVALFGWATGGQWTGYYASFYSDKVSALIMLNSLYGGSSEHALLGHVSDMEDPRHPGWFNQASCGGYRFNDARSLLGAWNRNIPLQNKNEWRDPAVADAYVKAALASDPTSKMRNPPSFRSPCGALEDSFYLATGRQLWDASLVNAPTLVLASEADFWSRPEDRQTLAEHLVHAARMKVVVIRGATHFVHLDRPERGRIQLINEVVDFLTPKCCLISESKGGSNLVLSSQQAAHP